MAAKKNRENSAEVWKQVRTDLKEGRFLPVYFLCGDQAYLRNQYRDQIRGAAQAGGDDMNVSVFTGKDIDPDRVIDIADTMPFFADRRVVILENTIFFGAKAGPGAEKLAEYIGKIPETTTIIFSEETADARTKLYKAIAAAGCVIPCEAPSGEDLEKWVLSQLKKNGLNIRRNTLQYFLAGTGDDMLNIRSELDKLCAYCMGRGEVTEEDIRAICVPQVQDRIFEMIDAVVRRDQKKALRIYMDLLKLQTAPQAILALMIRQINQLLQVRELSAAFGPAEAAARMKLKPFVVSKLTDNASRYKEGTLKRALEMCLKADIDYKSGKIDAKLAVETLIVTLSQQKGSTL